MLNLLYIGREMKGKRLLMKDKYGIPNDVRDQIIKDYFMKSYHWTIGIGMFLIGLLFGVVISG